MNEIKIDTTCSIDDYIAFNFYTISKYYKWKLLIRLMLVIGLLFVVIGFVIEELFFISYLGIFLLVLSLVYNPILKRNIKKMFDASPLMQQQSTLTIDKEHLLEVTPKNTSTLTWEDILHIGETNQYIYIFISKIQAYIINKSKLSEESISNLKSLIPDNIKRL